VNPYKKITVFLLLTITGLFAVAPQAEANNFAGMKYTIYMYNTEETSATMSFEANLSMFIDAYDGFGIYLPVGQTFTAAYWAPNYKNTNDLFLLVTGVVASDFIGGWAFTFYNYRLTGMFLYSGYVTAL